MVGDDGGGEGGGIDPSEGNPRTDAFDEAIVNDDSPGSGQEILQSMGYTASNTTQDEGGNDSTVSIRSTLKPLILTGLVVLVGLSILYFTLYPYVVGLLELFGI